MPPNLDPVHRCRLLVDGYNLLFGQGWGQFHPRSHLALQRGRETLASNLADRISAEHRPSVWIVFDSLDAPAHLPDAMQLRNMNVLFSRHWASADELLQQILTSHPSPRSVVVISSDHAVQRKAIARGSSPFDNDHWVEAIEAAFGLSKLASPQQHPKERNKDRVVSEAERDEWMKRFGF